jgi:hypothetical protein
MDNKFYVKIPFSIKEQAKSLNAKFDNDKKSWYVNTESDTKLFELVNVDVKFDLKDIAKENGAIWNPEKRCWMTCKFNVDNINKLMSNENINNLVNKKNELMKNPEIKLVNEIKNINKNLKESNKMIFPKW